MSDTVVSSVLSVTGTPRRWSTASGWAASDGTMPACQFEVGHRSRPMPRAVSSAHSLGSSTASGPWAIRSGLDRQRPADLGGAAPLPGVDGHVQPAGPRGVANARAWSSGSG